ncbi:hypothetical protein Tco_0475853 [Tanacetum coccineum]
MTTGSCCFLGGKRTQGVRGIFFNSSLGGSKLDGFSQFSGAFHSSGSTGSVLGMEKVDWMSWRAVVGGGGAGKGGSCVLIPDLVVMAKVGASGLGVSLLYRRSDRILEGKDHCRCLLQTSIPARIGSIAFEMEEMFMKGDGSSQRSSWYWTYSSILFHHSSSVRELKRNWVN